MYPHFGAKTTKNKKKIFWPKKPKTLYSAKPFFISLPETNMHTKFQTLKLNKKSFVEYFSKFQLNV